MIIDEAGIGELQCMLEEGGTGQGLDTSAMFGARYPQKQAPMLLGHLTALKVCWAWMQLSRHRSETGCMTLVHSTN